MIRTFILLFFATPALSSPPAHTVRLEVRGLEDTGTVLCSLWTSEGTWLDEDHVVAVSEATPHNGVATCSFEHVPAGPAAMFWMHDLDGDRDMDFSWLGLPTEPMGASRSARNAFGAPRWRDAVVQVPTPGPVLSRAR